MTTKIGIAMVLNQALTNLLGLPPTLIKVHKSKITAVANYPLIEYFSSATLDKRQLKRLYRRTKCNSQN